MPWTTIAKEDESVLEVHQVTHQLSDQVIFGGGRGNY